MKVKFEILLKLNAILVLGWAAFIFLFKLPNVDHAKLYAPYSLFSILLIVLGVGNIKFKRWSALLSLFLLMPFIASILG